MSDRRPPVVADLGRPETPAETAARKGEASRLRRARQTTRNLVYSVIVCVALAAIIVIAVPHAAPPATPAIDYRSLASQSQASVTQPLLAPVVPTGWKSNAARLGTTDGITSWYVGFVTNHNEYLAYTEGIDANSTWLNDTLSNADGSGTTEIGGRTWRIYDQRSQGQAAGNVAYGLATVIGHVDLAVYGTATVAEIRDLAARLAAEAAARGIAGPGSAPAA